VWATTLTGMVSVQAPVGGQLYGTDYTSSAFRNASFQSPTPTDLIFVATHNGVNTTTNRVYALRADNGNVVWTFNSPQSVNLDVITGQMWVDYTQDRLYIAARNRGGTSNGYLVLNSITGAQLTLQPHGSFLGNSPTPSFDGTSMLLGNQAGSVLKISTVTHGQIWAFPAGSAVQGYVAEDSLTGLIYFTTADGHVWCIDGSGVQVWKTTTPVAGGTVPLVLTSDIFENPNLQGLYVGSSDGSIRRYSLAGISGNANLLTTFTVGDPSITKTIGQMTTPDGAQLLVGTNEGTVYNITLPLP
jgi:outer membrane protein assembly factor BamB